jgi:hypothetical protein
MKTLRDINKPPSEPADSHMLLILHGFCPTDKERRVCTAIYWEAEDERTGNGLRVLAGIIYDGLTYGNWPWTDYMVAR